MLCEVLYVGLLTILLVQAVQQTLAVTGNDDLISTEAKTGAISDQNIQTLGSEECDTFRQKLLACLTGEPHRWMKFILRVSPKKACGFIPGALGDFVGDAGEAITVSGQQIFKPHATLRIS